MSIVDLARVLVPLPEGLGLRQGVVTAVSPSTGKLTVQLGSLAQEAQPAKGLIGHLIFFVGQVVWVLRSGADLIVVGPVGGQYQQTFLRPTLPFVITTALQDVTGMSFTFTTTQPNAVLVASLDARFIMSSGLPPPSTQVVAAYLTFVSPGPVETILHSAFMTYANPLNDDQRGCRWVGLVATPDTYIMKTQCLRSAADGTFSIGNGVGTGMSVEVWG